MKKTIFILLIVFLSIIITILSIIKNKQKKRDNLIVGSYTKDFILGMKNGTIYKLSDFIGKYYIILSFFDTLDQLGKINNIIKNNQLKSFLQKNKDIIWFNILKDDLHHMIIEEKTNKVNLSYRTLSENIPKFYNFKTFPSIIIINKNGIIHLVYSGYSPTIVTDILNTLKIITQ